MPHVIPQDLEKAAVRGEPSHVWRAGQEHRFAMLKEAAGERLEGSVLVDGCGVGTYLARLVPISGFATGIDIEFYTLRERSTDEILPWDFIDAGVTKEFLIREWKQAKGEVVTPNCRQKCAGCGARRYEGGVCYEGKN